MEMKKIAPKLLFSEYMKLTGVPSILPEEGPIPELQGRKVGVINGSNWISLWSTYFGKKILPGVKIINSGNEAVQLNFMEAHHKGEKCPPQTNIDLFVQHAIDLVNLQSVDAILISCSTMNRAFEDVRKAMEPYNVPVVQIDQAMMDEALTAEGKILVVATHGPTVENTKDLLRETAERKGKKVTFYGATVEEAFELLGQGRIDEHNEAIANAIRSVTRMETIGVVVLAQLSMSVFSFTYPNPREEFGVRVLNSGDTGFSRVRQLLMKEPKKFHHPR